jgi:hypothetical protein
MGLLFAAQLFAAETASTVATFDFRNYSLTVTSDHGTPEPAKGTHSDYCWRSTVTPAVEAVVGGYNCTGWTGTGSIPATGTANTTGAIELTSVVSTITWQWALGAATASTLATFDFRDYTLTVASPLGTPVPGIGTRSDYCWRSTVTPSVDAVVGGYTCTGWNGTGSIPATGTTNTTGAIALTSLTSSIAWQWIAATPAFTPDGGIQLGSSVSVTVTCAAAGATIRYTTDNSEPTATSTTVASGGTVTVPLPATLKAKAWATGISPSATKSASYPGTPPSVTTSAASAVITTTATLNGTVNPNGASTTAQFEYGLTTAYGYAASVTLAPANGTTAQAVSANLSGLQPNTTYHYRLAATNLGGTSTGADRTLTTLPLFAEIAVERPVGTNLIDGSGSISCGSVNLGSEGSPITFTVRNLGTVPLIGLAVNKDGTHAADFTVGALGAASVAPGASTTFTVTFKPGAAGTRSAAIHIDSNDADENPFDIALTGTGTISIADALDQPEMTVTQGGNLPWYVDTVTTYDGIDAARSGAITHLQESWMQITLTGPGTLAFWWKVSSEAGFDLLEFYLDGVRQGVPLSGTVDWEQKTCPIGTGEHTAKWRYKKDESGSIGKDAGWVDQVSFIPVAQIPKVATADASEVTATSATLNGTVNPNGAATTAQFEYGLTSDYGKVASVTLSADNGTTGQTVSASISDLQTGQTYHYRLTATNSVGPSSGADMTFTTLVSPPKVATADASEVTATTATLNGTVNPNGATTTAQFEYGLTTDYGSVASVTLSPANGTTGQAVSASISGLQAGQTYHYRLSATNSGGTRTGVDVTLVTVVPPIGAGELVAPAIAITGGNLNFTVRPSVAGRRYQLQVSDTLAAGTWQDVGVQRLGDGANLVITIPYVPAVVPRFYRLALTGVSQ